MQAPGTVKKLYRATRVGISVTARAPTKNVNGTRTQHTPTATTARRSRNCHPQAAPPTASSPVMSVIPMANGTTVHQPAPPHEAPTFAIAATDRSETAGLLGDPVG